MTQIYYSNMLESIRTTLNELRYNGSDIATAIAPVNRAVSEVARTSAWVYGSEADRAALLPPDVKPLFLRLIKQMVTEANLGGSIDFQIGYDPEASPENILDTLEIINYYNRSEAQRRLRSTWCYTPDQKFDIDGLIEKYLQPVGDASHIEVTPGPLSDDQAYITVRYKPEAVAVHLRRHMTPNESEGLSLLLGNNHGDAATHVWKIAGNGRVVVEERLVYNYRHVTSPPSRDRYMTMLAERRADYRDNLLGRLPGRISDRQHQREQAQMITTKRAESAQRFTAFRRLQKPVEDMNIPLLPFPTESGFAASRRWGIEIETGAGRDLQPDANPPSEWDAKGDGSLQSAYGNQWVEPEDCERSAWHTPTIEVQHNNGTYIDVANPEFEDPRYCDWCGEQESYDDDDCVELVSPILRSMHSDGLRRICRDLEHAPRTDTAGVHVHVEVKDLSVAQIKQLVLAYDRIEFLIEASYDRVERGYCKRRSSSELLDIIRTDDARRIQEMPFGDRYVSLNLQAIGDHGTVEFRAMGPRYNYDHLIRWAMFCREMVNVAAAGVTSKTWNKVKTWADVEAIFAQYGKEYSVAAGVSATAPSESDLIEV